MSRLKDGDPTTFMDGINAVGLQEPFTTACWLLAIFTTIGVAVVLVGRWYPDSLWRSTAIIAFAAAAFQVVCLGIFLAAAA